MMMTNHPSRYCNLKLDRREDISPREHDCSDSEPNCDCTNVRSSFSIVKLCKMKASTRTSIPIVLLRKVQSEESLGEIENNKASIYNALRISSGEAWSCPRCHGRWSKDASPFRLQRGKLGRDESQWLCLSSKLKNTQAVLWVRMVLGVSVHRLVGLWLTSEGENWRRPKSEEFVWSLIPGHGIVWEFCSYRKGSTWQFLKLCRQRHCIIMMAYKFEVEFKINIPLSTSSPPPNVHQLRELTIVRWASWGETGILFARN